MSTLAEQLESELELESEGESEGLTELEAELEGALELETEFETESELELAHELAHEAAHENEALHENFFNHLAAMADRGGRSQALRRIALAAARQALGKFDRSWPVVEGELEAELGEHEGSMELELSVTPTQRTHCAAMMEHSAHAAAESAHEQEAAEHFLPLIGLAAKFVAPKLLGFAAKKIGGKFLRKAGSQVLRRVASRVLGRATPRLTRGVANVTRMLFRKPATRPLIHALPRIARGTMATLVRRVARRQPVTPQVAARALARTTYRTLSNPRLLARTFRRSRGLDRRYHWYTRYLLGQPGRVMYRRPVAPGFGTRRIISGAAPTSVSTGMPCNCRCNCQSAGAAFAPRVVCPTCNR